MLCLYQHNFILLLPNQLHFLISASDSASPSRLVKQPSKSRQANPATELASILATQHLPSPARRPSRQQYLYSNWKLFVSFGRMDFLISWMWRNEGNHHLFFYYYIIHHIHIPLLYIHYNTWSDISYFQVPFYPATLPPLTPLPLPWPHPLPFSITSFPHIRWNFSTSPRSDLAHYLAQKMNTIYAQFHLSGGITAEARQAEGRIPDDGGKMNKYWANVEKLIIWYNS